MPAIKETITGIKEPKVSTGLAPGPKPIPEASDLPDDVNKWEPVRSIPKGKKVLRPYMVGMVGNEKPNEVIEGCNDSTEAVSRYVKKHKLVAYNYKFRAVEVRKVAA